MKNVAKNIAKVIVLLAIGTGAYLTLWLVWMYMYLNGYIN